MTREIEGPPRPQIMPFERKAELLDEADPAFGHILIDAFPAGAGGGGADNAQHASVSARLDLETVLGAFESEDARFIVGATELLENVGNLFLEPRRVPAEPVVDPGRIANRIPDRVGGRGDGDFDNQAIHDGLVGGFGHGAGPFQLMLGAFALAPAAGWPA